MRKIIRTLDYPIVETKSGKVHGFEEDGILTFLGIPYAKAARYELPEPAHWEGVKDTKSYGRVCPLLPDQPAPEGSFMEAPQNDFEMPHVYWPVGEDCLSLNIWTKPADTGTQHDDKSTDGNAAAASRKGGTASIAVGSKKPVMVWLHGGGYCAGSSIEQPAYNGHNLCAQQDVVVVTLNHRLNCLGFLDLSSFGEKYKYTGCLGLADILCALRWVHDSIATFGGDPENVTLFGQSGGGSKIMNLMQMPSADHLYRRGIMESAGWFHVVDKDVQAHKARCQRLGEAVVEALGLTCETIDEICTVPYEKIEEASVVAAHKLGKQPDLMLFEPAPVEGYFPGNWQNVGFRKEVKDISLIAGTTLGEFSFYDPLGDKSQYTEADRKRLLQEKFGTHAARIEELFHTAYPDKDVLYARSTDALFRPAMLEFLKAFGQFTQAATADETTGARIYNYIFTTINPYLGGEAPWHCCEIPFVFANTDAERIQCLGYEYKDQLEKTMSTAWANFARTGDPSTKELHWDPYKADNPEVMHFDVHSYEAQENDVPLLNEIRAALVQKL